jgi:DNA-binding CsgD family transcriptional regulator
MALTEREKAILKLSAKGDSDYRIARRLRVNSGTVSAAEEGAFKVGESKG